jgi:hypothetical protein
MSLDFGREAGADATRLDRRLADIGWGLLFMLTGLIWMVPLLSKCRKARGCSGSLPF